MLLCCGSPTHVIVSLDNKGRKGETKENAIVGDENFEDLQVQDPLLVILSPLVGDKRTTKVPPNVKVDYCNLKNSSSHDSLKYLTFGNALNKLVATIGLAV